MAGAGYKLFNTGDVLTAQQVNEYLMQQTVMVFANAAARTSALSGILAEGLVSYLKDTDVVEIYTGAAWVSLDDPNAIQNSLLTTTGDIIYASAANTPARRAIGSTGDVLTVSGGVPTWAAAATGGMTSLATGSLSSTTTTLSSISGAYRTLQLVIVGAQISTAGSPIAFTVNGTTSGYWRLRAALDTAAWSVPAATEASFRPDASNLPTTANNRIAILTIDEYATTGLKSFRYSSSSDVAGAVAFGNQTTITAAITSIGITSVAGTNSFSAGTYTLYGVK